LHHKSPLAEQRTGSKSINPLPVEQVSAGLQLKPLQQSTGFRNVNQLLTKIEKLQIFKVLAFLT